MSTLAISTSNFYSFIQSFILKNDKYLIQCWKRCVFFYVSSSLLVQLFPRLQHSATAWESSSSYQLAKSSSRIFRRDRRHLFCLVKINLAFMDVWLSWFYSRAAVERIFLTIMFDCTIIAIFDKNISCCYILLQSAVIR